MHLGYYVLRDACKRDLDRVLGFFKANSNANNAVREDYQLLTAIEDKTLLVVENKDTNELGAASGTFRYEEGKYVEAGATFVKPNLRGFGIQPTTLWIRALKEDIENTNYDRFFAVVRSDNAVSANNLCTAGFEPVSPGAVVRRLKNLVGKDYYELPRSLRYEHAGLLLEAAAMPDRQRKNGDTIFLEIDVEILRQEWRPIIHTFSAFSTTGRLALHKRKTSDLKCDVNLL